MRRRASEIDAVVAKVAEKSGGYVAPGFAERLRNAIAVPADKPVSECLMRLPLPGSGLEGNVKPAKASKASKKKGGSAKKKK